MVVEDIDPKTGKPKKDKGRASNTKDLKLSDYDPLFLHANDSNGNPIYSSNAKDVWDELEETYSKTDGSLIYNMHLRSSILITEPLPDVKYAFAALSRDESYRSNNVYSMNTTSSSSSSAFVSRSNNDWSANKSSNL
nr:ribonuclease H-like domain-containing protein [Tanacetum cinerariifolium]